METIKLNLIPGTISPVVHVSQYDVGRVFRCLLFEGSSEYVLSNETITIYVRKPDGKLVTAEVTVTSGAKYVDISTTQQMDAVAGKNICELKISKGAAVIGTINFYMEVERDPTDGAIASESEIHDLQAQVDADVQEYLSHYASEAIGFDPTGTDLESTNVEDAIKEVNQKIDDISDPTADNVEFDPTDTDLESTNVEAAIKEVNDKIEHAGTGTVTNIATGAGLTGGPITSTGTIKANLRSETPLTRDSVAATEEADRVFAVVPDKSGKLAVVVPAGVVIDDTTEVSNKVWSSKKTFDEIVNILPTGNASGSIANFNTSLALPMEIVADVNASGGGGTPMTPIPIVGVSAVNLVKCGGNLWDEQWENGIYNTTTGEKQTYNLCIRNRNKIYLKGGTNYYIYLGSGNIQIYKYDKNDQYLGYISYMNKGIISLEDNVAYINFNMNTAYGATYNNNISVNPSSDTEYHEYVTPITTLINLGGTYYGGYVSQDKNGKRELVVTHGFITLDGTQDIVLTNWRPNTNTVGWIYPYALTSNKPVVASTLPDILCNKLEPKKYGQLYDNDIEGVGVFTSTSYGLVIRIAEPTLTTKQAINSYLTDNPITVVFELAEPYTVELPDGEPINSLVGTNNVYADSGDIEVIYKKSIDDAIAELQALILS